jgi:hypothetical protein
MTTSTAPSAITSLASELFPQTRRLSARVLSASALALVAHTAIATYALGRSVEVSREPPPLAVEFLEPIPEPPPLPQPEPEAAPPERAERAAPPSAAPPPAARAANLMTAKEDLPSAQAPDEPFDFTTDPNGSTYGGGVVARGGTADFGVKGATVAPSRAPVSRERPGANPSGELVALSNLSRKPALGDSDPCRGFFPSSAQDDTATTGVFVVLSKAGRVTSARVVAESPAGQGFGAAARACMLTKSFVPALDRSGNAAATSLRVNIRFRR